MCLLSLPLLLFLLYTGAKAGEVIGGTECKPHSHPYMAYLEVVTSEGYKGDCGGFLIRQNFMLTAAHCAGRSVIVNLGVHNKKEREDTWQRLKVVKQFLHPNYNSSILLHDIMLLKLEKKANLTLAVGTVPLPPECNFLPSGRMCRAAGWGQTNVEEPASGTLQEGDSGGPLLCAGIVQGIISYAQRNAKPPVVFTRISHYRPWINKILKAN